MKYLKLVNCPIRGLFPTNGDKINWIRAGFEPTTVARFSTQGCDSKGDHVSVMPIKDETKLKECGIIETVNNNDNPRDTARIITEATAKKIADEIKSLRGK